MHLNILAITNKAISRHSDFIKESHCNFLDIFISEYVDRIDLPNAAIYVVAISISSALDDGRPFGLPGK